jgi:hypothetical protein
MFLALLVIRLYQHRMLRASIIALVLTAIAAEANANTVDDLLMQKKIEATIEIIKSSRIATVKLFAWAWKLMLILRWRPVVSIHQMSIDALQL